MEDLTRVCQNMMLQQKLLTEQNAKIAAELARLRQEHETTRNHIEKFQEQGRTKHSRGSKTVVPKECLKKNMARDVLLYAVEKRDVIKVQNSVEELTDGDAMERRSLLNHRFISGWTLLHHAAESGSLNIVKYLVDNGAEVNGKDDWETTALHVACDEGHNAIVEYLLQCGGMECINDIEQWGKKTPLTAACSCGHTSVVRILIKYQVDIKKPDGMNNTALEWSIEEGYDEIVSILRKELKLSEGSQKYQTKLQKLSKLPHQKITKIGPVTVCFEDEFVIGEGCKGTCVYVGLLDDGTQVAVKRMLTYSCRLLAENEKSVLSLLQVEKSPHIVNYRYYERSDPFSYLVLDLCEETLEDYVMSHSKEHLQQHGPTMIREILTGLKALHSGKNKILHMDLKPSNIFVDNIGHMRLADFGLSRILSEGQSTLETGTKGTKGWMAVESNPVRKGEQVKFKRKSDIQVVGMISFYILTKGRHPFGPEQFRIANIIQGKPDLEQLTYSEARNFVSWLINHDINNRPYVEEALDHAYLLIGSGSGGRALTHI